MIFDIFKPKTVGGSGVKPFVLLILDGWGVAPPSQGNPISLAKIPNMNQLLATYPNSQLLASGESVGLPSNEVGNTEVGHLTIGSGRIVLQPLKRINCAIEDGTFFDNKPLRMAYEHAWKNGSKLHLLGLVGSGNVHSNLDHLKRLLDFYKRYGVQNLYLHLFTDGRDSPPKEALDIFAKIEDYCRVVGLGRIASISGRYFAMDRDRRWERTQKAYEALLGMGEYVSSAEEAIKKAYAAGLTDEFINPSVVAVDGRPVGSIGDNDAVVFFNFRIDRPRQLTMAFTLDDFETLRGFEMGYDIDQGTQRRTQLKGPTFKRVKVLKNLFFVTMTEYQKNLPVSGVAFPPPVLVNTLPEVLSNSNVRSMHIAESEKERMVTYYFRGMRDQKFPLEDQMIIPSPNVLTYDKKPEMSVFKLVKEFRRALDKGVYGFFVINFANPDMVAHTGNIEATVLAIEATDKAVGEVVGSVLERQGTLVVTADHGNAEDLLAYPTGTYYYTSSQGVADMDHSNNPVPIIFVGDRFRGVKLNLLKGSLSDVAPTILALMGIPKPTEMTGKNIIQ